jgi:hypothetical protein
MAQVLAELWADTIANPLKEIRTKTLQGGGVMEKERYVKGEEKYTCWSN